MSKIRTFITSFILGAILLITVPVAANTLNVLLSTINVTIGGKNTELTLLNYDGILYVPLTTIFQIFEGTVDWETAVSIETYIAQANKNEGYIISAGRFVGGVDLPPGRYELIAVSGAGYVHTTKLDNSRITPRLTHENLTSQRREEHQP